MQVFLVPIAMFARVSTAREELEEAREILEIVIREDADLLEETKEVDLAVDFWHVKDWHKIPGVTIIGTAIDSNSAFIWNIPPIQSIPEGFVIVDFWSNDTLSLEELYQQIREECPFQTEKYIGRVGMWDVKPELTPEEKASLNITTQ